MEQRRSTGLCRTLEKTSRALGPAKPCVQCGKRCAECLGNSHVPGVIRCQVSAQLPNAVSEGAVWEKLDAQRKKVGMGKSCRVRGNLTGKNCPAQDIRHLDGHEMRGRERSVASNSSARVPSLPLSMRAATTSDASTTSISGVRRRGRQGFLPLGVQFQYAASARQSWQGPSQRQDGSPSR